MAMSIENLFYYIQNNENNLVKDFLKNNIDIKDHEGRTALIHSAFCNNFELLNWLIKNEANINIRDNNENSALHYACLQGAFECIRILLENNITIEESDIKKEWKINEWDEPLQKMFKEKLGSQMFIRLENGAKEFHDFLKYTKQEKI